MSSSVGKFFGVTNDNGAVDEHEIDQWLMNTLAASHNDVPRETRYRGASDAGPLHPYLAFAPSSVNTDATNTNGDSFGPASDGGWCTDQDAMEAYELLGVTTNFMSPPKARGNYGKKFLDANVRTADFAHETSEMDCPAQSVTRTRSSQRIAQKKEDAAFTTPAPYHRYQDLSEEDPSHPSQSRDDISTGRAERHEAFGVQTSAKRTTSSASRGKDLKSLQRVLVSPNEVLCTPQSIAVASTTRSMSVARQDKNTVTPLEQSMETLKGHMAAKKKTVVKKSGKSKAYAKPFPILVHEMVTGAAESHPDLIQWVADGEAFKIKPKKSQQKLGEVLKKYFRHTKYTSLQRQLNMYGWKKHTGGKYEGAFHHPDFHRDRGSTEELAKIQRNGPPSSMKSPQRQPKKRFLSRARKASKMAEEEESPSITTRASKKRKTTPPRQRGAISGASPKKSIGKSPKKSIGKSPKNSSGKSPKTLAGTRKTRKRSSVDESMNEMETSILKPIPRESPSKDGRGNDGETTNAGVKPTFGRRSTTSLLAPVTPSSNKKNLLPHQAMRSTEVPQTVHISNLSPSVWSPLIAQLGRGVEEVSRPCALDQVVNRPVAEPDLVDEKKRKAAPNPGNFSTSETAASPTASQLITVSERPVGKIAMNMSMFQGTGTVTLTSPVSTTGAAASHTTNQSAHERMEAKLALPQPQEEVEPLCTDEVLQTDEVLPDPPMLLMRSSSSLGSNIPAPEPLMRSTSSSFLLQNLPFLSFLFADNSDGEDEEKLKKKRSR